LPEDYSFQYLNVPEFQFNGRLHLHFVVFGMDYLINLKELRQWWKSHGMDEMVHAYSLKKNPKDPIKWTWKILKTDLMITEIKILLITLKHIS
jgi:hypothetical protein